MVAKSIAVLILVVACASVEARFPINGLIRQIKDAKRFVAKTEVVFKSSEEVGCADCDDCDDDKDCGDSGCCPYVINDCDQDKLFICCDPCTGNICGTSIWACEQDAENSVACQNRNKLRFLKTIQL